MKSTVISYGEDKVSIVCPICDHRFVYGNEYADLIRKGCTCDCRKCGNTLDLSEDKASPFHEKINQSNPEWPKDGKGTASVEVSGDAK